jgi:hypothetical protein
MIDLTQRSARFGVGLFSTAVGLVLCLASCSKDNQVDSAAHPSSPVLAKIGDEVITVADFEAEIRNRQDAGTKIHDDLAALLDDMVNRKAMVQSALARGLDQDPVVARVIENLLISELRQRELVGSVEKNPVSEAEIQKAYAERAAEFTRPGKVRLAILSRSISPGTTPARKQELVDQMEGLREQALALPEGERFFGSLASKHSEDQASRYRDGDAGWFDAGRTGYRWPDKIIAAGFALGESGEVSGVIEIPGEALYLLRKVDSRGTSAASLDSVKAQLTADLSKKQLSRRQEQFLADQREQSHVQLFPEYLEGITIPSSVNTVADVPPPRLPSSR